MPLKSETVAIRITAEEKELIQQRAQKEDVSISKYLYRLLIKEMSKEGQRDAGKLP